MPSQSLHPEWSILRRIRKFEKRTPRTILRQDLIWSEEELQTDNWRLEHLEKLSWREEWWSCFRLLSADEFYLTSQNKCWIFAQESLNCILERARHGCESPNLGHSTRYFKKFSGPPLVKSTSASLLQIWGYIDSQPRSWETSNSTQFDRKICLISTWKQYSRYL